MADKKDHFDDNLGPMEKFASEAKGLSIGAISRGVYHELRSGTQDRELATKIAMDNLRRDPSHYE